MLLFYNKTYLHTGGHSSIYFKRHGCATGAYRGPVTSGKLTCDARNIDIAKDLTLTEARAHAALAYFDDAEYNLRLFFALIMDPLSVTLAVVTLATAVKDMVELGQKIHESFTKVSNNLRKAQRVANDIKEMMEKFKVFYESHQDALDKMENFRVALLGLLDKFRSFETSILPLLPKMSGRRLGLFVRGWWNNNKIEECISDLQRDIVQVMLQYMMESSMRAEVKLEAVHQDTSRGLTGITQGLEVLEEVRRDVSTLRITTTNCSHEPSRTTNDELARNIIIFAQSSSSSSAPMLRAPNVITEELLSAAYIKLQVNIIALTVEKMSTMPASALNDVASDCVALFQLFPILEEASMSIMHLRHHLVRQVTGIRDLLETERIHTISIREGAVALSHLSFGLGILGMPDEAKLVGKWATTVARSLVDTSSGGQRQPDLAASLAINLLNQSVQYYGTGNKIQSLQAIEEAHAISQNLRDHYGGQVDFQILYCKILLQYSELVDNHGSIKMCIEAVQVLEDFLNIQAYTLSDLPERIQNVVHYSSSFIVKLFSSAPPRIAITTYAFALRKLGNHLFIAEHPESALDLQLLAISIGRKMVSIHGDEHKAELAMALSQLVQSGVSSRMPAADLVNMADECIQILQELAEKNPLYYSRTLVSVLWVKANKLQGLNRGAEALATWEEVAMLAGQIIHDSKLHAQALSMLSNQFRRLKKHDDALRTGRLAITTYHEEAETQALRYFLLSRDLRKLHRYKESADPARTSVALYRRLAMGDPAKWMVGLAEGLSDLSHCLAASGDNSEAVIAWQESASMLDNLLKGDPDATSVDIDRYLRTLYIQTLISFVLEDEGECLKVSATAAQYLRRLSEICPPNDHIIQRLSSAEFRYAYNMLRFGHLQDTQQYIDHWIRVWSSRNTEAISESLIAATHAGMVILKADVLNAQGCTKEALLTTQKVPDIVGRSVTTYQFSFIQMIDSMVHEASLQVNLGNGEEGLQVAEEALQLSRDNKLGPLVRPLVWSLHAVAFAALSRRNYKRAIEAAQEGFSLSTSPNWQGNFDDMFMRPSLFAIWSSAEANLGRCSIALEYAHRAVDASLDIRDRKADIPATVAEHSYMETRGYLADILLATGDLTQARQICEERSAYFSKRIKKRMGNYRELAPILRMLGILCCSEGHHEDGDAAAKELSRIMKSLGSVFPSLQEEVKICLRSQAKVPILRVLDDMQRNLNCEHQAEVLSLFAI